MVGTSPKLHIDPDPSLLFSHGKTCIFLITFLPCTLLANQKDGSDGRIGEEPYWLGYWHTCCTSSHSPLLFQCCYDLSVLHRQCMEYSGSWKGWKPLMTWWFTPTFNLGTSAWKKSFKKLELQSDAGCSCLPEVLAWGRLQKKWLLFLELTGYT